MRLVLVQYTKREFGTLAVRLCANGMGRCHEWCVVFAGVENAPCNMSLAIRICETVDNRIGHRIGTAEKAQIARLRRHGSEYLLEAWLIIQADGPQQDVVSSVERNVKGRIAHEACQPPLCFSSRKAREEARAMAEPVDKKNVPDSLDNGSVQQAKGKPLYKSKKSAAELTALFKLFAGTPAIRPD